MFINDSGCKLHKFAQIEQSMIYVAKMSAFTEYLAAEIVKLLPEYNRYKALYDALVIEQCKCEHKDCSNLIWCTRDDRGITPYLVTNIEEERIDTDLYISYDCRSCASRRCITYCSSACVGSSHRVCHNHRSKCNACNNYKEWLMLDENDPVLETIVCIKEDCIWYHILNGN